MGGIREIAQRSRQIVANLSVIIAEGVKSGEVQLLNLNREQMLAFKRADDQVITPPYAPGYAAFKGHPNPNLKLTGAFHRAMYLETDGANYFISSRDEKTPMLIAKYTEDVFGIAPSKQPEAKKINVQNIKKIYLKRLLSG